MGTEAVKPELIKKRMWLDYQYACNNPANESFECVQELISELVNPELEIVPFLQKVADAMTSRLGIKEVTIGLRDAADGLYRYKVMSGLSEKEWEAHRGLAYRYDDFFSQEVYKFMQISKYTRLYLAEDNPYAPGEEGTTERELAGPIVRRSLDETVEGDYIDILIFGRGESLLGWIEMSGMRNDRFPDAHVIKCLELLASVIGVALSRSAV